MRCADPRRRRRTALADESRVDDGRSSRAAGDPAVDGCAERRRSRVPWIYLVYHAGRASRAGADRRRSPLASAEQPCRSEAARRRCRTPRRLRPRSAAAGTPARRAARPARTRRPGAPMSLRRRRGAGSGMSSTGRRDNVIARRRRLTATRSPDSCFHDGVGLQVDRRLRRRRGGDLRRRPAGRSRWR